MKMNHTNQIFQSPWPMMVMMNAWAMAMYIININKSMMTQKTLIISIMIMTTSIMTWFTNTQNDKLSGNKQNTNNTNKMMIKLIILSETLFFSSMFYNNYSMSLFNNTNTNMMKTNSLNIMVAMINLIVLLTSSITMMINVKTNLKNCTKNKMMKITLTLSFYFMLIQNMEYKMMKFNINNSMLMSNFFMLTMFHMTHVMIGMMMMLMVMKSKKYFMNNMISLNKLTCWYWHFVDSVWIMIFISIYCFNNINNMFNFQLKNN